MATSAPLTASAFNQLGQYANSPGNRAYCYAELVLSSLVVAVASGGATPGPGRSYALPLKK